VIKPPPSAPRIAIVGGGLAGLACADRLRARGLRATIYEADPQRLGGRCWSLRGFFPGQVAERGGEFIDTTHKTFKAYANKFNLQRADVTREPGDVFYFFGGTHHSEEEVVDQFRELVSRMRPDIQASSGAPTFFEHNDADVILDFTDLATYLDMRGNGLPLIRHVLAEAYIGEYGLEPHEQSSLNLLLFIHLDRRSKFAPFGVFSDERFHLVDGNDGIVRGIAQRLPGPIELGRKLQRLSRNMLGEYELYFEGTPQPRLADAVVMTLPFTVLREIVLDPSLNLSADKLRAINELGYGSNAKTMVGFVARPWSVAGGNGTAYSDLPDVQVVWETNSARANASRAVLTDYAGGDRGRNLLLRTLPEQVSAFLSDVDLVFPGAQDAARIDAGQVVAHREHWPSNPLAKGGFTCYRPGQFTGLAGLESQAAGALKFAGEHADSFYSWQGFMEGALLSGIRAANEILNDIQRGRL
jgi:monoamine oxidase